MEGNSRYVFDTNTLLSAALFENGKPGRAFRYARRNGTVLLSQPALDEIEDVLAREDFDDYVSLEDRADFIERLVKRSQFADPTEKIEACRDSDDDKFLELVVSESAVCIVSGDKDLLVLNPFRGIPIMKAADFLNWIEQDA
jgi:putative PIN family toxin of toxin-antitoxin system